MRSRDAGQRASVMRVGCDAVVAVGVCVCLCACACAGYMFAYRVVCAAGMCAGSFGVAYRIHVRNRSMVVTSIHIATLAMFKMCIS